MSVEAIDKRNQRMYTRMAALRKIVKEKLDKPDQLNYDLFERETRVRLNEAQFKPYLYAVRTFDGPQLLPELAEIHPFQTVKDYDNWIARINCQRHVHRPVDRVVRPGCRRAAHAAAHHDRTRCSSRSSRSS